MARDRHRAAPGGRLLRAMPGLDRGRSNNAPTLVGMYCIAVDPAHRREGLGTAIVSALLERLGEGVELGYLQLEETNAVARGLYGKLGFSEQYRRCHRVASGSCAGRGRPTAAPAPAKGG